MKTLAVVVSEYPALSHAFIRREVVALRALGVPVQACSLHPVDPKRLIAESDRAEADRTVAVRPRRAWLAPFAAVAAVAASIPNGFVPFRKSPRDPIVLGERLGALAAGVPGRGARTPLHPIFYYAQAEMLIRRLDAKRIGHIHAHFANAGGEVARIASRLLGVGFSLTLHGHSDLERTHPKRLAELVNGAVFVACVTEAMRDAVAARVPDARAKLHVVRCGLDAEGLGPAPRAAAPGASPRLRILHVGRLAPEKDQALLLDAFADARAAGLDAELRVVGEGPERAALERRLAERELTGSAELVGPLAGAALTAEYAAADLFAMSSRMEGLPVVLMEAFAQGVPCVAPAVGGIAELVRDENGWLFPAGDRAALAACLVAAGRERAGLAARGAAGRSRVLAQHDVRTSAERLRALIAPRLAD